MSEFHFKQVDVFTSDSLMGNPLAVVLDADGLSDERMSAFAKWTNLSETTFLLKPVDILADYRVRIFTTLHELPFAGHPTLGSCHAWLEAGGVPKGDEVIQECGIGLVRIRRGDGSLAFTAPPLLRSGAVDALLIERIRSGLGLTLDAILDAQWVDNGAGWLALMLPDRESVMAIKPDYAQLKGCAVGVFAPWNPDQHGTDAQFEVRAFIADDGMPEDPVTGSLNAGIAQWLLRDGLAPDAYVVSQGTALGRAGRIYIERSGNDIWVGGASVTCIDGSLKL